MIRITVFKERTGITKGFECRGHAGYGRYGTDIVCAAVSALTINAVNSVQTLTDDVCTVSADEESGAVRLEFDAVPGEKSRLLMDSLELGLKNIEQEYGRRYVELVIREV